MTWFWDKRVIIAVVAAVLATAWLLRYDAVAGDSGNVFVTDHWTGHVYNCGMAACYKVYPPIQWLDLNSN